MGYIMKILFILLFTTLSIQASPYPELSKSEVSKLENGEYILVTKSVKDRPWPVVIFYKLIEASSLESVAVFYALEHQSNYIPNLLKSKVVGQRVATEADVRYELKMPWPLSNGDYIHGHKLSYKKQKSYKVNWWLVKSNTAKEVKGSAIFSNYKGNTLLKYESLVVPQSFLASFVEGKMLEDVKSSLVAIRKEILRIKNDDKSMMKELADKIHQTLNGKFIYFPKKNN